MKANQENLILQELKLIHSKLNEHDEEFKFMHSKFDEHDIELRNISNSVAKIEVEHGKKIDTLVDVTSSILEKLDSLEKGFESNVKQLNNHSNRIWNLESKVGII